MQKTPVHVGDVPKELQWILGQQPPGTPGPLVTTEGQTLLASGSGIVSAPGSTSLAVLLPTLPLTILKMPSQPSYT